MQDGFADLFRMEVPPDDLLANGFSDEMFDMEDYLNELLPDNIDSGRPPCFPEGTGRHSSLLGASQSVCFTRRTPKRRHSFGIGTGAA